MKSEDSILLKETVTHSLLKEICGALRVVHAGARGLGKAQDMAFALARSGKNLCSSSLFDFRMIIKCTVYSCFHWILHGHHCVLYLMHMHVINDAVY